MLISYKFATKKLSKIILMGTEKELTCIIRRISFVALLLICTITGIAQAKLTPVRDNSSLLWGYTNEKGKMVIAIKFNTASEFFGNLARVSDDKGYFLINSKGKRIITENCEEIKVLPDLENSFLIKIKTGYDEYYLPKYNYNIVRQDGKMILAQHSDHIRLTSKIIIYSITKENGSKSYGITNLKGEMIAAPVNYLIPDFYNGITVVKTVIGDTEKYGVINTKGEILVPFEYDNADFTYGDYHKIVWAKTSDKKYHFFDKNGRRIENMIADEFKELNYRNWFKPVLLVRNGNKWGFFNGEEFVLNFEYDEIFKMNDSLIQITLNGKTGVANTKGEVLIPAKYISVKDAGESYFTAKSETGTHLYNSKGIEVAVLPQDLEIISFNNGIGIIRQNKLYGYMDHTGNIIIPCQYDDAGAFREGRAHIRIKDVFKGYIDLAGNRVSENEYIKEKADAAKAEQLAKEKAEKEAALAKAEKEQKTLMLDTYFPYRYSNAYCRIRLSEEPKQNESSIESWGTSISVYSYKEINYYPVGCQLIFRINNAKEIQLANKMHLSLLDVFKKALEKNSYTTIHGFESCKFKGYDAFTYYYEKETVKCRAIAFQVNNNVFSLTLMGMDKYYDDNFFDLFTSTFEPK